jgi:TM2 domain-containing membrane protein YozV
MYKIIGANGQQYGPVNEEQIRHWLAENRVNTQTLMQSEGGQDWRPLGSFPEFASEIKSAPPTIAPPQQQSVTARASNKIAAGICGILLGAFGIHKFILGYTGAGVTMLLITLLTCGIAGCVVHLIGLIEGIIYLTKSDEEFVRIYVDGRKEWF